MIRVALLALPLGLPAPSRAEPVPDGPFRAMVERPLFSPTRRPAPTPDLPAADAPALPDPPQPAPLLTLSGIVAGGGGGVALLQRPQGAAPVHVALGGRIDGWTVAEIHPRAVVLRRDDRSVTIDLSGAPR